MHFIHDFNEICTRVWAYFSLPGGGEWGVTGWKVSPVSLPWERSPNLQLESEHSAIAVRVR